MDLLFQNPKHLNNEGVRVDSKLRYLDRCTKCPSSRGFDPGVGVESPSPPKSWIIEGESSIPWGSTITAFFFVFFFRLLDLLYYLGEYPQSG